MPAARKQRPSTSAPLAVPPWVITALLLGVLVLGLAAALLLIPPAARPTLQDPPAGSTSR